MMSYARVLLLDDDPLWIETLTHLCQTVGARVFPAPTIAVAKELLKSRYINIAFVDISLYKGDAQNSEGMAFLKTIGDEGLSDVIQPIVVSGYPDFERGRQAFHDFKVVDFLEKKTFQAVRARKAIEEGLTLLGLCGPLEIEIAGNQTLSDLLGRHQWASREDMEELTVEFRDLLRRLFPGAEHLFVRSLPAGQSGAGVLEVEPTYADGVGAACIVKFGKKDKIQQESRNVSAYVENFAGAQSSTQISAVCQRIIAAIRYQLVGTSIERVVDFDSYYPKHTVGEITEGVLNSLLRVTCRLWYDNRSPHRRKVDLIRLYSEALSIEWDQVENGVNSVSSAYRKEGTIAFLGIAGRYVDPLAWREHTPQYHVNAWQSITHGDLNQHNILIGEDGQCWLIDFYRTGQGHILRDIVELEAVIKISLTDLGDLEAHSRLEKILLGTLDIDKEALPPESDPLYKPLAVIAHLRRHATGLTSTDQDMREYNAALLMQLYKMLSLDFLSPEEHEKILLSAAMLCSWLENGGRAGVG